MICYSVVQSWKRISLSAFAKWKVWKLSSSTNRNRKHLQLPLANLTIQNIRRICPVYFLLFNTNFQPSPIYLAGKTLQSLKSTTQMKLIAMAMQEKASLIMPRFVLNTHVSQNWNADAVSSVGPFEEISYKIDWGEYITSFLNPFKQFLRKSFSKILWATIMTQWCVLKFCRLQF